MIALVGTPDPEPLPWGVNATSVTAYPAIPNTAATASWPTPRIPWLRLDRKNTVPIFPVNPEGAPA